MSVETSQEPGGWFARRLGARFNIRLVGAASGVLLALLIAPATRRLVLSQMGLTLPVPAAVASVAGSELGIKPDPFERQIAMPVAHAVAARHPDDLQVQIANAGLSDSTNFNSMQKIQRLRALETRFADRPELYANILRYEAMGSVKAQHLVEQCLLAGTPAPTRPTQAIDTAEYAAYDRDAAAGECLDPNNAYFPFMRAIGLFGAGHDDEALAEIGRAARKTQWREYYNEELLGQWRLQDEGFVNNSALFHSLSAAALLFPQYAQMRGAGRVTIYAAMQAEQAGRTAEGLEMRKNVLRLGSLMRIRSQSLICALVGIAITEQAMVRPDGAPPIKYNEPRETEDREKLRRQFDAYLERIGHTSEIDAFHTEQRANDEVKDLIRRGLATGPFDNSLHNLICWWFADLMTLSNLLWLLVFGGLAALALRNRRLQSGQALSRHVRLALPLGLIGGALAAPAVLAGVSPYFLNIADGDRISMLFTGLAPALLLLVLPAKTGMERKQRMGMFGGSLLAGILLTGFYFWQTHGIGGIACLTQVYANLSNENGQGGPYLTDVAPWGTADVSILILSVAAIISRACRVPLSVGLARAFRGLAAPLAAVLLLAYGGMMLGTIRAEATVQYGLERTVENEGQYIADLIGKLSPHSKAIPKMIDR